MIRQRKGIQQLTAVCCMLLRLRAAAQGGDLGDRFTNNPSEVDMRQSIRARQSAPHAGSQLVFVAWQDAPLRAALRCDGGGSTFASGAI